MADMKQKTQAEKAASAAKQKAVEKQPRTAKKDTKAKPEPAAPVKEPLIPVRALLAIICLFLFVVFLVMALKPDGALLRIFRNFLTGLVGKAAFYISIPALLYLFSIQAFSAKRPVIMRSVCLICFVLVCGCIAHLCLKPGQSPEGIALVGWLYNGGAEGATGGVICGLIAMLLRSLLGSVLPFILLAVAAVLTLLAAFQITIPSVVRAYKDRPRGDWEDEEKREPRAEPSAMMVNYLAEKHIQHVERKRNAAPVQDPQKKHASDLMRQIGGDVNAPVAVAGKAVKPDPRDEILTNQGEDPAPKPVFSQPQPEPVLERTTPVEPVEAPVETVTTPAEEPAKKLEPALEKVTAKQARDAATEVAEEIALAETVEKVAYCFPPIDLLSRENGSGDNGLEEMRENSRRLNEILASFKIGGHIINVTRGPSVTRYEAELEPGVTLSRVTSRSDDIALNLGAPSVRIAPVPNKVSIVGIEVPNHAVTKVMLRDVIASRAFNQAKAKASFAVGKDIGGEAIVGNITKLPHMLIAGTTGSGKSVCMNSIIISLLYKASPDDVKLIMVDPKMVELGTYNGIPHLLIPVVTDPKKAAGSLQWAVTEMMRRYKAMSDVGVRDLESYNSIMENEGEDATRLPQIVVIIDELADLMLVAAKEVEESICRIAQMGRAAGIHLIIATQRPSADVITGLMKANIPSRIAFAVSSAMESRIILDTQGAEKLVGKGDMLYAPIGCGKPMRVQGCFVSDAEVEAVANYVKSNFSTDYDQSVMDDIERKAAQTGNSKVAASDPEPNADELAHDEMLPAAVEVLLETGQASVSMIQRRLKLGYARAARIMDEMEEMGIVGPFKGSKPREILMTREQWEAKRSGQPTQLGFDDLEGETPVTEDVPEDTE